MTDIDQHYEQEIEAARQRREERDRIVETRPGRKGETYEPNTPWRRQDQSPHPVPEHDADGGDWRITGQGLHVGSSDGEDYCLEWLPTELLPEQPATATPAEPIPDDRERDRHGRDGSQPAGRPPAVLGGGQADTDFDGDPGTSPAAADTEAGA